MPKSGSERLIVPIYRYAMPVREKGGETYVMVFYIVPSHEDGVLKCLADDLMIVLLAGFESGRTAECARG